MNRRHRGNTYSTICSKLCAIRWHHRNTAGYDPGVNASHAILLRGIRRFTDLVGKQQPLTARLLRIIFDNLDLRQPRDRLLWGERSITTSYDSQLFRFSTTKTRSQLRRKHKLLASHAWSEKYQFGREEVRYQYQSGDKLICPVRAARWVRKAATMYGTSPDEPALSLKRGDITSEVVSSIIKKAAGRSGLDPARYSTHSVRIGGATALLNAGADRLVIKRLGRWMSNAFEDYPVLSSKGVADLSRHMC
ncbi:hypothetical protein PHMEG_0009788 [Phytophthora megakarya]|uniref:Tyr recombinase domain-containing protein n=1 Tax=Phytophthora megakarya TaxID=4795 RepID=A0A225WFD5_9STRA|nr:hypothetical protein PHMEG_0009788 [Phytophthora megakarya]